MHACVKRVLVAGRERGWGVGCMGMVCVWGWVGVVGVVVVMAVVWAC